MKNITDSPKYSQWRVVAPCPFCAGPPAVYAEEDANGLTMSAQIRCSNCGASGPIVKRERDRRTGELDRTDPGTTALNLWCSRRI